MRDHLLLPAADLVPKIIIVPSDVSISSDQVKGMIFLPLLFDPIKDPHHALYLGRREKKRDVICIEEADDEGEISLGRVKRMKQL